MRPLRHLPATVSDVQGTGRGDGLAARPDLPDAGRRRGTHRADRDLRPSPRPLSRLPSVRERVPLRRPLRLAPRGDTRPAPAPRSATPAAPPGALHLFGVPRARARRRSARAPAPLSTVGAPAAGAIAGPAPPFPRLGAMEGLLGDVPRAEPLPELIPARGRRRGRVGLLTGCVQGRLYPGVNRDTARLLALAGWEVVVPRAQGCCGALELHAGKTDDFRVRARRLVATFGDDVDWVVTNAAGCGSALKEYGHWVQEARGLAARTRDVTEMLVDAELSLGRLELTVTYHDPCHLAHAQGIRREPRQLLRRIPGLRLVELAESDLCCGSAGVYSILEPEVARELMELKVARIAETGATVVATGNPGCLMQIAQGCRMRGLDVTVVHPVELLARAADAYPG